MVWRHADLARDFSALEQEMELIQKPTWERVRQLRAKRLKIHDKEPPVKEVLNILCHIEVMRSIGYTRERFPKVRWYQKMAAHFWTYRPIRSTARRIGISFFQKVERTSL